MIQILLVLLALFLPLAAFVLALLAFFRASQALRFAREAGHDSSRRLSELEAALRAARAPAGAAPAPAPFPAEPPRPEPGPEPSAATEEPEALLPEPSPAEPAPSSASAGAAAPSGWSEHDDDLEGWPGSETETETERYAAPRRAFDWERWVGVRGAAVVGAVLLALAGLLFFRHALEQEWIGDHGRVLIGSLAGLGALAAGESLRRRGYRFAPAGTTGAGIVILYATTWAAHTLIGLIGLWPALLLMAAITVACALLAVRQQAQGVAALGLVGGFATPVLIAMPAEAPGTLFGYLLLLDLGLLALGARQRWSSVGVLAAIGTMLVQGLWVLRDLSPDQVPFALFSLAALGTVLAFGARRVRAEASVRWLVTQATSLLLPFAFALHFASRADLGEDLWPLGLFAAVLTASVAFVERREAVPWLLRSAAAGAVALLVTWTVQRGVGELSELELCLTGSGLGALHAGLGVLRRRSGLADPPLSPLAVFTIGALLLAATLGGPLSVAAGADGVPLAWIFLCGGLLVAFVLGQRSDSRVAVALQVLATSLAALALAQRGQLHDPSSDTVGDAVAFLSSRAALAVSWRVVLAAAFLGLTLFLARRSPDRGSAPHLAGVFAAILLFMIPMAWIQYLPSAGEAYFAGAEVALPGIALLALVVALPSLLVGRGRWQAVACALFLYGQARWYFLHALIEPDTAEVSWPLPSLLSLAGMAILIGWPLVLRRTGEVGRLGWLAALLLVPAMQLPIESLTALDPRWSAASLAALTAGLLALARARLEQRSDAGRIALPGLLFLALGFAGLTFARLVDHGTVLVALSLLGPAGVLAGIRFGSRTTIVLGHVATGLSGLALLLTLSGTSYYPVGPAPLFNWTAYISGVPVLSAFAVLLLMRRFGADLLPAGEVGRRALSWASSTAAFFGAMLWLTLQVLTLFEELDHLRPLHDLTNPVQTRDLAISAVWIGYALALLLLGMNRGFPGLRQASLGVLLITLTKLFLRDFGELSGLYLVVAVAGLATSLLLVSILYQRFVFPRRVPVPDGGDGGPEELSEEGSPPRPE